MPIFLSPLHADVLYALYHLNLWPEVEKLKRTLAALAPTYDFTRYNHLIDERTGPVVYWPEAFHFAPALGKLMAEAMTGVRTANLPENFGVTLDASNIEASLAAWREERDSWIAQHPDSVQRMRKAQENFQNGVSFKAVTDETLGMAAGRSDHQYRHCSPVCAKLGNPSRKALVPCCRRSRQRRAMRSNLRKVRFRAMSMLSKEQASLCRAPVAWPIRRRRRRHWFDNRVVAGGGWHGQVVDQRCASRDTRHRSLGQLRAMDQSRCQRSGLGLAVAGNWRRPFHCARRRTDGARLLQQPHGFR